MSPERWAAVERLFYDVLDREPGQRAAYLDEAAKGDPALAEEVRNLLSAEGRPDEALAAFARTGDLRTLAPGTRLGPYEVVSLIGAGGMGEVYEARDTRLARRVAVKVLPRRIAEDPDRRKRFEGEARAISRLNHPHICALYDVGESEGRSFLVMEYLEGETLADRLAAGPLPVKEALRCATEVAEALGEAHRHGIVHRDLKPGNVILTPTGAKLLDFGLAKATRSGLAVAGTASATKTMMQTEQGMVLGTAAYMSPEQARGLPVDQRTDLWSLGTVVYEMLTGRPPFAGPTAMDVVGAILQNEPAPPARLVPGLPAALDRLVMKALRKDASERHQTAEEVLQDLRAVGQQAPPREGGAGEAGRRTTNLAEPLTPLLGRNAELSTLESLLREPEVRLLTLTGPSGIGKTRLALQVAADLIDSFADGVFVVSLASVRDPELVAPAMAQALAVRDAAGRGLVDSLKDDLRERHLLVVLDNFEQVLASAPLVSELLEKAPRLKVLATSRAPLHVRGEHEFPVAPLALPPPAATLAEIRSSGAVALFCDRAAASRPDFGLGDDAGDVAEICRRLDGLPLAIELAAARVKVLSPRALLERLSHRLDLLTRGPRDLPARQQTMRDAIAWSYDLLDEAEKALFRRLSIFSGGCTLEAAAVVGAAPADPGVDPLEGLASLVDKSLLRQREAGCEPRFEMLETIREYGFERLAEREEVVATRSAHAQHFLAHAEGAAGGLAGPGQAAWLESFELEHDNLRAALEWLGDHDATAALRLASVLWRFWEVRGHLTEGRARLEALLSRVSPASAGTEYAKVVYAAGVLADAQGDYAAARALFERNLAWHRATGNKAGLANSLNNLAVVVLRQQDYASARALYEESLALWRELGNATAVALSLCNLGHVARRQKDHARARALYDESLALFRSLNDERGAAWSLNHLGDLAREQSDPEGAAARYTQSLAVFRRLADASGMARALADLGRLAASRGESTHAWSLFAESLTHHASLGDRRGIAGCLEELAVLAAERDPRHTARFGAAAAALREALGIRLSSIDEERVGGACQAARRALGESAFMEAWDQGARERLDTLVAEAAAPPLSEEAGSS